MTPGGDDPSVSGGADLRERGPAPRPVLFSARDLLVLVRLPLMALVAWSLPPRWWHAVCRPWARLSIRLHAERSVRQHQRLNALFGPQSRADADRLSAAIVEGHNVAHLQILRCHRPGTWRPRIDFAGREHVVRALEDGRGAILWVAPLSYAPLITKMALAREGFRVSQLSRENHGLSGSRFGIRVLNPIVTSAEDRYLAERLVMSADDSTGALRTLVRRVRDNHVVTITVAPLGRRTHAVPLPHGALWVADGAPLLALRTGAALLPAFTFCTADDAFATVVEPPLTAAPDLDRPAALQALFAAYAAVLERYLARWPEQFAALEAITLLSREVPRLRSG